MFSPREKSADCATVLRWAIPQLAADDTPQLTAEVLLAHLLGRPRTSLLAHLEQLLTSAQTQTYQALIARAAQGEPLAYLTGHREFYGLDFAVDARVLIPRPESELLIDLAKQSPAARLPHPILLDVGTGSGCLAVTLAVQLPHARVLALDISPAALAVAQANAVQHHVAARLTFLQNDLLAQLDRLITTYPPPLTLLVANLPYIAAPELATLPVSRHEPRLALAGGPDGLDLFRRLLAQAPRYLAPHATVLLEIGHTQGPAVRALAQQAFPHATVQIHRDFAGLERVVQIAVGGPS